MDDKIERVNQLLEDMLRMYVIDRSSKWENYLHLVEFAYNKEHQSSLGMSPYKYLYGGECKTPFNCDSLVDRVVFGPKMVKRWSRKLQRLDKI